MKLSAEEGELAQRKVNLDAHEEELAVREEKLGGALKQAEDAAAAAEAAKKELETKVASWRPISPRRAESSAPPRTPTRILS